MLPAVPTQALTWAFYYSTLPEKAENHSATAVPGVVPLQYHPGPAVVAGTARWPFSPAETQKENSRWYCKPGLGANPPITTLSRAVENNRQLSGIIGLSCVNVPLERRFPDVTSKPSAASGIILRRLKHIRRHLGTLTAGFVRCTLRLPRRRPAPRSAQTNGRGALGHRWPQRGAPRTRPP